MEKCPIQLWKAVEITLALITLIFGFLLAVEGYRIPHGGYVETGIGLLLVRSVIVEAVIRTEKKSGQR